MCSSFPQVWQKTSARNFNFSLRLVVIREVLVLVQSFWWLSFCETQLMRSEGLIFLSTLMDDMNGFQDARCVKTPFNPIQPQTLWPRYRPAFSVTQSWTSCYPFLSCLLHRRSHSMLFTSTTVILAPTPMFALAGLACQPDNLYSGPFRTFTSSVIHSCI